MMFNKFTNTRKWAAYRYWIYMTENRLSEL